MRRGAAHPSPASDGHHPHCHQRHRHAARPALPLTNPDDAHHRPADIVSRMSDVELLAELRCIAATAARRGDQDTAQRASQFFSTFYDYRITAHVPAWLSEGARAFARVHAP